MLMLCVAANARLEINSRVIRRTVISGVLKFLEFIFYPFYDRRLLRMNIEAALHAQ